MTVKSVMLRLLAIILAAVLLLLTLNCMYNNSLAGFPDGHITDYEKAVSRPFEWLCNASGLFSLYFVYLGLASTTATGPRLRRAVFAYIVIIVLPTVWVKWYYQYYLQLDNGIGG